MLYKLDTMRRRDVDEKQKASETPSPANEPAPEPELPKYTAAQVKLAREIINKNNYYDILSVARGASDEDLKKAYKKFAIKLHPDKNHAPQASEAFKKVANAYACLTDPEKKRIYDQTGEDPGNGQSPGRSSSGGRRGHS